MLALPHTIHAKQAADSGGLICSDLTAHTPHFIFVWKAALRGNHVIL